MRLGLTQLGYLTGVSFTENALTRGLNFQVRANCDIKGEEAEEVTIKNEELASQLKSWILQTQL